ncbi:MAG: hypothetical protein QNI87_14760 [Erythrobacter sp.]|uniref:COG3650 family protein n=1 Tax=Erythrobacter sp. TaxID=1042 RepID=UPI0026179B75|nr:hypothetical protein [Erythrobacter sp.]MDJ0979783.1 hypothetical protein [Erythrobacter sp.]
MPDPIRPALIVSLFASAAACGPTDGIDDDGAIYDGVAPGAEIRVTGTEPFFAFAIEPGEGSDFAVRYTNPETPDGIEFIAGRFAGNNGISFSGELEGKAVQIAITPGECSDGMSDRVYPFTATVAFGEETLLGCAYTSEAPFAGPQSP